MNKVREIIAKAYRSVIAKLESFAPNREEDVNPITNQSLDQDRKEVIKRGRQHVAPVSESHTRILIVSIVLGVGSILLMSGVYWYSVFRNVSASPLVYQTSQIIPTPVGVLDGDRVFYDQILFQLNTAYKVRGVEPGQEEIEREELLKVATDKVIENSAILQLAKQQQVEVSEEEISARVALLEETTGSTEKFEASLRSDYGWTRADFLNEFRIQLLKEKLRPSALDEVSVRVNQGEDFASLQEQYNTEGAINSFVLDDKDSEAGIPSEVIDRADSLSNDSVSDQIVTEFGSYFLERQKNKINVIFIGPEAVDQDLQAFIDQSEKYICLNAEYLEYEARGFLSCIF